MSNAPYRFDVTHRVCEVVDVHANLEPGAETDTVVTVAGRLMLRRDQGKLAFGSLQDSSGRVQLFAMAKSTPSDWKISAMPRNIWCRSRIVVNPSCRSTR